MKKYRFLLSLSVFLLLLPFLSLGQRRGAIVAFTIKGLPEEVRGQMTPQAIDSLHDSLVRQLVRAHRLECLTPLQPEKIRFITKGRPVISRKLKAADGLAGNDYDLYLQVYAELQIKTVFAGLKLPIVKVKMAVFDRTGRRVLLTESLGKDGIAHAKEQVGRGSGELAEELNQERFKKMYYRAVTTLRTGGLSAELN